MRWRWQWRWSCGGLVGARLVDWRWIGGGEVEGVGGRVALVVEWGSDEWRWQLNYHIVVGGIDESTLSSFVTRRAFFCRRASSRCSVVGLDVNVFGGLDVSLSLFVMPPRLLPPLHCHQRRCRHCHRRSCRRCNRWFQCIGETVRPTAAPPPAAPSSLSSLSSLSLSSASS